MNVIIGIIGVIIGLLLFLIGVILYKTDKPIGLLSWFGTACAWFLSYLLFTL